MFTSDRVSDSIPKKPFHQVYLGELCISLELRLPPETWAAYGELYHQPKISFSNCQWLADPLGGKKPFVPCEDSAP